LLNSLDELRAFVAQNSEGYERELERLHGCAQLKLVVSVPGSPSTATSGTEYLRSKSKRNEVVGDYVAKMEALLGSELRERREIIEPSRLVRLWLVSKSAAHELRPRALSLLPPAEVKVEVSGPWPPSDFVTYNPQSSRE
jgi:hypothetical protein